MALFRRAVPSEAPPVSQGDPPPDNLNPPPPASQDMSAMEDRIVGKLMGVLQNLNPPPASQPVPSSEAVVDPDADIDAAELERIDRRAARQFQQHIEPWSGVLNKALPDLIRNQVVSTLSPGQQKLYQKYSKDVDDLMKTVRPEGRAEASVHRKAISQVLGEHLDEVEALVVQSLTPEDLPPTFAWPTTSSGGTGGEPATPTLDKDMQFQLQESNKNNPRKRMTEEEVAYWNEAPVGVSVAQMVEWHRENQAKKTAASK